MTQQEFDRISLEIKGILMTIVRRFNRAGGQLSDGEDIVQEALMTLWDLSRNGYPIRDPKALAIKITKTKCVAHYRKKRLNTQPLDGEAYAGELDADNLVRTHESEKILEQLLSCLTSTQRYYFMLRNEYSLSLDEISLLTKKPKASIKVTLSQARRKMLDQLRIMHNDEK